MQTFRFHETLQVWALRMPWLKTKQEQLINVCSFAEFWNDIWGMSRTHGIYDEIILETKILAI